VKRLRALVISSSNVIDFLDIRPSWRLALDALDAAGSFRSLKFHRLGISRQITPRFATHRRILFPVFASLPSLLLEGRLLLNRGLMTAFVQLRLPGLNAIAAFERRPRYAPTSGLCETRESPVASVSSRG
jgi:hypothetical protein